MLLRLWRTDVGAVSEPTHGPTPPAMTGAARQTARMRASRVVVAYASDGADVFVLPPWRGRAVGRQLVDEMVERPASPERARLLRGAE